MLDVCLLSTSQLLELLHDLNQAPQAPPLHRYDLQPPSTVTRRIILGEQASSLAFGSSNASTLLHDARQGLRNGTMSMIDYRDVEDFARQSKDFKPTKSYASLLEMPYASLGSAIINITAADSVPNGYPAPREEELYLEGLDSYLDGTSSTPRPFAATNIRGGDRSTEKDREMALKNPVSVYNWLRKHQPQVFLQDNEGHPEKSSTRPATSRASKRASAVKQEPDLYDEDGIALDIGSSSRGKRKRDDDGGYRPKGGNGRPVKRKKEDGSASAKKSKRASISGLT